MQRVSERSQALQAIAKSTIEVTAWVYVLASLEEKEEEEEDKLEEDLEDLSTTNEVIASTRDLSRGESASHHC